MLKHLDLFSGIGGFALAADRVFGEVEHIFCDNDKFCQQVLKKHWPTSKIYGDIRTLTNTASGQNNIGEKGKLGATTWGRESGDPTIGTCDLLTGGFPCQPFSQAGRRRGTEDDRYLWPEMFRVIQLTQPEWVIAENVRGLVTWDDGMVLETVCSDLESEGYEVQPFIIPACAVGAPHRRERVWIVANSTGERQRAGGCYRGTRQVLHDEEWTPKESEQERKGRKCRTCENDKAIENAIGERGGGRSKNTGQVLASESAEIKDKRPDWQDWSRDWREVALATCHDGMDDGISRRMGDVTISGARWRKEALKAYGNAIVPKVAEEILKEIKKSYGTKTHLPSLQSRYNASCKEESKTKRTKET